MRGLCVDVWKLILALRAPLLVTLVVLAYTAANYVGTVPSPEQLSGMFLDFFTTYGAIVVAPMCFLENFAPVNAWFPGALAILTAMSSTSGNLPAAIQMFFVIWVSSLLGILASFFTGRFLRARGKATLPEQPGAPPLGSWMLTFVVFFHPYTGSLNVFRMGATGDRFALIWKPVFVSHLLWSIFWAITTYQYGLWLYSGDRLLLIVWAYLVVWIGLAATKHIRTNV